MSDRVFVASQSRPRGGIVRRLLPDRWRAWLRQGGSAKQLAAIAHLLTGNFGNAILMLGATTLAARTLGPAAYGIFAMVLSIGRISERFLRFESWQPLIKFIADEEVSGTPERKARLFLYGFLLDFVCAIFAAILAVVGGWLLLDTLQLKSEHLALIAIYAVTLAIDIRGMPTAALRLAGQFRILAYVQMASSVLRIALAAIVWARGGSLMDFVIVWTAAQMTDQLVFLALGFRALGTLGIPNPLRADRQGLMRAFPGFLKYAWATNFSSTLRSATQEVDTLLVGAMAGSASAGFYYIAKRIAKVALQVGAQVQAVLYPDMARMWAQGQLGQFRIMTIRAQLALAGVGLFILTAALLAGRDAIGTVLGADFAAAYPLLIAQLIAVVLVMHAAPSRSALLAMHRPQTVLGIDFVATAAFFAVALLAIPRFEALGANIAHIVFGIIAALAMDAFWWGTLRHQRKLREEAASGAASQGRAGPIQGG